MMILAAGSVTAEESFSLRGRLQSAFEVREWLEKEGSGSGWVSSFQIRRARLEARWQPESWARLVLELEGAGQIEFADRYTTDDGENRQRLREQFALQLRDAYGRFSFYKWFFVQAGNFKKPFSRLRLTSPWDLLLPLRGLLDDRAIGSTRYGGFGGRDAGVQVGGDIGTLLGLRYHLGVFSGQPFLYGVEQSTKDFVGRVEIKPIKVLRLALNVSHKLYHYKEGPTLDGLALRSGHVYTENLFGADARIKIKKFVLFLEGAYGDNVDFGPGHRLWGAHAISAYRIKLGKMALVPAVMADFFDPSDHAGHELLIRLAGALNFDPRPWLRITLHGEWTAGEAWRFDPEAGQGFGGYVFGRVPARLMLQVGMRL